MSVVWARYCKIGLQCGRDREQTCIDVMKCTYYLSAAISNRIHLNFFSKGLSFLMHWEQYILPYKDITIIDCHIPSNISKMSFDYYVFCS